MDSTASNAAPTAQESVSKGKKSAIQFPYVDIETAKSVARVVKDEFGGRCSAAQLAPPLGHMTAESGAFQGKTSGALMFGFVNRDRESFVLTELGSAILSDDNAQAKVSAFLNVPLYRRLYDQYKRSSLPKENGLQRAIADMGVLETQAKAAMTVFMRSAEQAGFFTYGKDRLVLPARTSEDGAVSTSTPQVTVMEEVRQPEPKASAERQAIRHGNVYGLHPAVSGALETLPNDGEPWDWDEMREWLEGFEGVLRLAYGVKKPKASPNVS